VSQGTIRSTVDISSNVIASSRAVDVDVPIERPSLPHFVASDTRQFSPIVTADKSVASSPLSRGVDTHTQSKRLYAAAHAPLAPPTPPVADLSCHERDILSSSTDSDYPPASQRENCPPWLGTQSRPPSPLSATSSERSGTSRSLYQLTQLATQLVTTVKDQLKSTRDDAAQRELRMFNDIAEREQRIVNEHAEREYRFLSDAAERDRRAAELEAQREQRLLDDARHARELEAQREQILVRDAQSARQELLADIQLQRDREAQREIDMRRDMYDLAAQRSRAAALEAELKCLKANIGTPTVAYEVIDVPVQLDDIAPPEVTTAVQMSPLRPVAPIDNLAVQGLPVNITQRQLPVSSVHRSDTAHALTWNPDASADNCHGAGILTSQSPYFSSATNESTVCRFDLQYKQHQSDTLHAHMPVQTVPRELPQPSTPGSHHRSDALSRRPVTAVSDPLHTFPRSPPQPACTQSTMTSMLPWKPAYTHDDPPPSDDVLISALPRPLTPPSEDVVTSALPHPLTAPADFAYNAMQRPADCVDYRNVYTHSIEQLAHLPPPPPVNRQSVPLLSDNTQTTASAYMN